MEESPTGQTWMLTEFLKTSRFKVHLFNSQTGFLWQNAGCVHLCSTWNKNNSFMVSAEDELRSLTAWGKKLLRGLMVRKRILLYRLPDGRRVNRLLLWRVLSLLWDEVTIGSSRKTISVSAEVKLDIKITAEVGFNMLKNPANSSWNLPDKRNKQILFVCWMRVKTPDQLKCHIYVLLPPICMSKRHNNQGNFCWLRGQLQSATTCLISMTGLGCSALCGSLILILNLPLTLS